jgi:hypothetical protein
MRTREFMSTIAPFARAPLGAFPEMVCCVPVVMGAVMTPSSSVKRFNHCLDVFVESAIQVVVR